MDFKTPVAGIPVGVWGIVVVGAVGVGVLINRRKSTADEDPSQVAESGVGQGGSGWSPVPAPTPTPGEDDTNEKWRIRVTNWLLANGYDPTTSDSAVRKYISGQSLMFAEQAIISVALIRFGAPPEPISGPPPGPPSAVSNLVVTGTTGNSVSLAWTPSVGATHYEVVASSKFGAWPVKETVVPSWTSASAAPLGSDLDHTFTVWAVSDLGKSEPREVKAKTGRGNTIGVPVPPLTPAPPPQQPAPPQRRTHVVRPGDTLSGIALQYYGSANRWREIYHANNGVIEDTARRKGKPSSRGGPRNEEGWWIFAGTTLVIP